MDGAMVRTPTQARVFESGLYGASHSSDSFDQFIRGHLQQITQDLAAMGTDSPPTPPAGPLLSEESATLLRDLGDYFTRTSQMWSSMAHNLLQGPHIDQVANDVTERSHKQTRMTDFSALAVVEDELDRLRKIRDLTTKFSQDVQAVWRPSTDLVETASPTPSSRGGQMPLSHMMSATTVREAWPVIHGHHGNGSFSSSITDSREPVDDGEDSETDDEELFAGFDINRLKQRGKGAYTCPKGLKCDKGGVDKDGNIVLFDRNSAFLQHYNKHRKPWVCELENCPNLPNKRRFARRDGLERHKQTVKHVPKGAEG